MLSQRFQEIAQKPNAPFMGAGASRGLFVRTKETSTLSATSRTRTSIAGSTRSSASWSVS